jgi:heme exporter protein C
MLVLLFLYFGYIALADAAARQGSGRSRVAAIFGLVGAINVPIINRSVVWWNSLHQPPSITMGNSAIDVSYLLPLLAATVGFSLIFGGVVLARMRTLLADMQAEARLRRRAMAATEAMSVPIGAAI